MTLRRAAFAAIVVVLLKVAFDLAVAGQWPAVAAVLVAGGVARFWLWD